MLTIACSFSRDYALLVYFAVRGEGGLAPARVAIVDEGGVGCVPGEKVRVLRPAEGAATFHVRLTVSLAVIDVVVRVVYIYLDYAARGRAKY